MRHRAVCANVRNQTTGAACAPRPLTLLLHGAPPQGPPLAAASRLFVASSMWRILRAYDGAPLHLSVQLFAIGQREPPVLHGHWRSCRVPLKGPPLARSVAPGRCIFTISNLGQLLAKKSVETWFCSPGAVRHRAVCANVRNQTTGASCAPQALALLSNDDPPQGPPLACSVAPGRCIFRVRRGVFCVPTTAHRCTCLCNCSQSDNGSRLCSTATGEPAPWRPTAGSSSRSQRRARSLHLHHFESRATRMRL